MKTPPKRVPVAPAPSAAMIADALSSAVIGHDATLLAFATELRDQLTLAKPTQPTGIFLLAGPDLAHVKDAIACGVAKVLGYDWNLYNLADPELSATRLFKSGPTGPRPGSLTHQLMTAPHSIIILDRIEQADPHALERLMACWRSGFIFDMAGLQIPTDAAIFVLTTAVAQESVSQIARAALSADQRHIACLKLLCDAGLSAALLRHVDAVFCLEGLSLPELALACRRRLEQQVASHGLTLAEDGLDAEVLAGAMTSALGVSAGAFQRRRATLDLRLAEIRKAGATRVRQVMDGDDIGVVPVAPAADAEKGTRPLNS
ncbi:MAG: hypothetical protein K0S56_2142 [Microvirga sp.]|jgi:ATP-dependent Clp protease ATP-binding subunit ClpA|nr:hypothetical protein [Microvirga sp.]